MCGEKTNVRPSSIVRKAVVSDVDSLVDMGSDFLKYSAFSKSVEFDREQLVIGLCSVLDSGIIFVAECDGEIIGGIVGMISRMWFCPSQVIAAEMGWWMSSDHRGGRAAIKLLRAFEGWAKEEGADHVVMSDLVIDDDTPTGDLFKKLGYTLVERAHIKGV